VVGTHRCHHDPGDGESLCQALATLFTPLLAAGTALVVPGCLEGTASPSHFSLRLEVMAGAIIPRSSAGSLLSSAAAHGVLCFKGCCGSGGAVAEGMLQLTWCCSSRGAAAHGVL